MQTDMHPIAHADVSLPATLPLDTVAAGECGELIAAPLHPQEELARVPKPTPASPQMERAIDVPFKTDITAEGVRARSLLQSEEPVGMLPD